MVWDPGGLERAVEGANFKAGEGALGGGKG
jgi:hypothetical protein